MSGTLLHAKEYPSKPKTLNPEPQILTKGYWSPWVEKQRLSSWILSPASAPWQTSAPSAHAASKLTASGFGLRASGFGLTVGGRNLAPPVQATPLAPTAQNPAPPPPFNTARCCFPGGARLRSLQQVSAEACPKPMLKRGVQGFGQMHGSTAVQDFVHPP